MSYISRILNENLSDNESDDEICILEEITLNKDETKVSPMKTEVRQEVIESTIEIEPSSNAKADINTRICPRDSFRKSRLPQGAKSKCYRHVTKS